ncbi:alpha/beta fold hydrolase [Parapedobacter koreensis]|uniref:Pimeloyl-ACP methyl ester carboxylesterase n=1 Tax=Parapedobacter koreensis TaxID=332977 RepID=A0A1H7TPX8_9SPHI|nr:alpha/beta hydrolase [Parapedobacter koreensis]SEL86615.1 Pimeloyl-ACP methyl ester carboxylesterase [Parapedobacter koreensis]
MHYNKMLIILPCVVGLALLFACPSKAQDNLPIGTNLETIEYPYTVEYITLQIQGETLKMAYMDAVPEAPNGEAVLLLHGKNFNGAYWERTANDLTQLGYRVVMPDQIGFGKSSKPNRIQYTFQLLAMNTKKLLDSLGIGNVHVLGHSMGGMLATRFALMYPDQTQSLILENPIGLEDWKTVVPYQTVDDWYQSELVQTYDKIKNYQLTFYYDNKWKAEYDRWVHMLAGWTNDIDYPRIAWNSALLYDMIFTQPVVYEFSNIKAPTLLLIGQRDRTALGKANAPKAVQETLGNYPLLGKKAAAAIPGAQLVEIEGIGHLPHIEAYERFIEPLRQFLTAH